MICGASLVAQVVKNTPWMQETQVRSLGQEDPVEMGMATHSSILAWRIPWTKEPGRLQSWGCKELETAEQLTLFRYLRVDWKACHMITEVMSCLLLIKYINYSHAFHSILSLVYSWNTLPKFFLIFQRFIIFLETGFLIMTIVSNTTSFTNIYLRPDTSLVLDQIPKFITLFLCPWDSPGKNTGVGCHSLLQGIFPTQGRWTQVSCMGRWGLYHWATW